MVPRAVSRFAHRAFEATSKAGSVAAVVAGLGAWLAAGAWWGFPAWWQAAFNTAGWAVALVMLFVLQHGHRRDMLAVQLKLNELVRAVEGASDQVIAAERLDHDELEELGERHRALRRGR